MAVADLRLIQSQILALDVKGQKDLSGELSPVAINDLRRSLRQLDRALQSDSTLVDETFYAPLDLPILRIGHDLNIFGLINDSPGPLSFERLLETTRADSDLLERVLRYLTKLDVITEHKGHFSPSRLSRAMTSEKADAMRPLLYEWAYGYWIDMPGVLAESGWAKVDANNTPFMIKHGLKEPLFDHLGKNPDLASQFNKYMTLQYQGRPSWFELYPLQKVLDQGNQDEHGVAFIDIGGGWGGALHDLTKRFPDIKGRVILQDLEHATSRARSHPEYNGQFEVQTHDFFGDQPEKGAKFYFLRNILHDWEDSYALKILAKIVPAMTPGYSRLLINDLVIADGNAGMFGVRADINMMGIHAALERTEKQWREITAKVGLKIVKIWKESEQNLSVVECVVDA